MVASGPRFSQMFGDWSRSVLVSWSLKQVSQKIRVNALNYLTYPTFGDAVHDNEDKPV